MASAPSRYPVALSRVSPSFDVLKVQFGRYQLHRAVVVHRWGSAISFEQSMTGLFLLPEEAVMIRAAKEVIIVLGGPMLFMTSSGCVSIAVDVGHKGRQIRGR